MLLKALKASFAFVLLLAGATAQAATLGLTLAEFPDISAGLITVSYDATSDTLTADGFPGSAKLDAGPAIDILGGMFTLSATIDNTGAISGGTIVITGMLDGMPGSGTLITGNLTTFGFPDAGGDPLGFLFDVTGGDLAPIYGSTGAIILAGTDFDGDWNTDFANSGDGVADTGVAVVPLPAPFLLLLSALVGVGATSRRR